ncbi:hypothetical protein jhhlp_006806 [Lomentospora prolificans]|uniref:Uncharacterized protein n=1 Tax=Lomentospora prolificans TaxID=41688 RepID=A0A2N3N2U1_9PEZI|nr:hypothetical protein jhhlp_006806 [Lomentospora prolificans]
MPTLRRSTRARKPSTKGNDPEPELEEEETTPTITPKKKRGRPRKSAPVEKPVEVESQDEAAEPDDEAEDPTVQEEDISEASGGEGAGSDDEAEPDEDNAGDYEDGDVMQSDDELDESVVESDASENAGARRKKKPTKMSMVDSNAIEPYPFSKKTTRAYEGPFKRQRKTPHILQYMYGPEEAHIKLAYSMLNRFYHLETLPGRPLDESSGPMRTPWVPDGFEAFQQAAWGAWIERYRNDAGIEQRQRCVKLSKAGMEPYLVKPEGNLVVLLGPYGEQTEATFPGGANRAICLNETSLPIDGNTRGEVNQPKGWIFDAGGLVLSLAWAPRVDKVDQVLALCVVPHSDQRHPNTAERDAHKGSRKHGIIKFWKFTAKKTKLEDMVPKAEPPILLRTLMFDWGRARRIKWCPVPPTDESLLGLLGVLTGDGKVRVLEIENVKPKERSTFSKVENPMFTLSIPDEHGVEATAFAWVNTNRIVVGYTDGSLALWSLYPLMLLSRHPVHTTYVVDIASGYPSRPYLIASSPVSGFPALVDFSCPTHESTGFTRTTITTQANLLQWNDPLQGFVSCYPSGSVTETSVGFMHHRYFPHVRRVADSPSLLTCLASGYTHPFLLTGLKDGSVWACNAAKKIFATRQDRPLKLKVFEHEFRPADRFDGPGSVEAAAEDKFRDVRGAVRILEGWDEEPNVWRIDRRRATRKGAKAKKGKASKKKKKNSKAEEDEEDEDGDPMDVDDDEQSSAGEDNGDGDEDGGPVPKDTRALINHEPFTRIMVMEWNPNLECGCWAAIAAASGLVRVMDLAVDEE